MTRPCAFCGDPTERVYSVDMDLILEEVHIDIDAKDVLYVKPRAAMLPLFELVRDEKVWPGDPERSREAMATLSPALISGVEGRVVFAPWEIAA